MGSFVADGGYLKGEEKTLFLTERSSLKPWEEATYIGPRIRLRIISLNGVMFFIAFGTKLRKGVESPEDIQGAIDHGHSGCRAILRHWLITQAPFIRLSVVALHRTATVVRKGVRISSTDDIQFSVEDCNGCLSSPDYHACNHGPVVGCWIVSGIAWKIRCANNVGQCFFEPFNRVSNIIVAIDTTDRVQDSIHRGHTVWFSCNVQSTQIRPFSQFEIKAQHLQVFIEFSINFSLTKGLVRLTTSDADRPPPITNSLFCKNMVRESLSTIPSVSTVCHCYVRAENSSMGADWSSFAP